MPVTNGQVVRVDLVGDFDAVSDIVNVFQYKLIAGDNVADEDVLGDMLVIMSALLVIIKNLATILTVWRRIRVTNLSTGVLLGEASFSSPVEGTSTGDSGAAGVAALISLKTNIPRVVLRKYFGPLAEGVLGTNGRLSSGALDILTDVGEYLLADQTVTPNTWQYGILSPKTNNWEVPSAAAFDNVPAYQRRRRPGSGS